MIARPPSQQSGRRSRMASLGSVFALAMLLILMGAMVLVLPLLGLIGVTILLGVGVFGGIFLLHYLVWGRWIARVVQQEAERQQDEQS